MVEPGSVIDAIKELFLYNRENFMFDRTINQLRVYHTQKMRISQVRLYRDDLDVLFDLTIRKMDSYLVVNVLLLLFCGGFLYEGRLPAATPAWLLWLWTMSLGSAILFLLISIWFAIHASITAQTFSVRILTQWLRLPIPGAEAIHAAAALPAEFEKSGAKSMLHVPVVGNILEEVHPTPASGVDMGNKPVLTPRSLTYAKSGEFGFPSPSQLPTNNGDPYRCYEKYPDVPNDIIADGLLRDYDLFLEHFYLFRELQRHWQGFDAYARIGMVIGTNMFLSAFAYMALAYFLIDFSDWGALSFPIILATFEYLHALMNIRNVSVTEMVIIATLIFLPQILAIICGVKEMYSGSTIWADYLSPVIYLLCGLWVIFLILLGSEDDGGLPMRFVTCASIDVLGLSEDSSTYLMTNGGAGSPKRSKMRKVDKNDTPVAFAVPAASVVAKGEELRRMKQQSLLITPVINPTTSVSSIAASSVPASPHSPDGIRNSQVDNPNLPTITEEPQEIYEIEKSSSSNGRQHLFRTGNEQEEIGAYKASLRAQNLPWRGFRQAGAVIVALWIFAITYSILASYEQRWGWPKTNPFGDGEETRRLSSIVNENNLQFHVVTSCKFSNKQPKFESNFIVDSIVHNDRRMDGMFSAHESDPHKIFFYRNGSITDVMSTLPYESKSRVSKLFFDELQEIVWIIFDNGIFVGVDHSTRSELFRTEMEAQNVVCKVRTVGTGPPQIFLLQRT